MVHPFGSVNSLTTYATTLNNLSAIKTLGETRGLEVISNQDKTFGQEMLAGQTLGSMIKGCKWG